jgi:hypothetical protein
MIESRFHILMLSRGHVVGPIKHQALPDTQLFVQELILLHDHKKADG